MGHLMADLDEFMCSSCNFRVEDFLSGYSVSCILIFLANLDQENGIKLIELLKLSYYVW